MSGIGINSFNKKQLFIILDIFGSITVESGKLIETSLDKSFAHLPKWKLQRFATVSRGQILNSKKTSVVDNRNFTWKNLMSLTDMGYENRNNKYKQIFQSLKQPF